MNDQELSGAFSVGGERHLELAIDRYGEGILRYVTAIVCNYHDAEEVVQEVFIAAYQGRDKFDGENLKGWLYKIAYHRALNKLKQQKIISLEDVKEDQLAVWPKEDGLSGEMLVALRRLKPMDRAVIYGRIMEEMSFRELSAAMGPSEMALRKRYERNKRTLAGYLRGSEMRKEKGHETV